MNSVSRLPTRRAFLKAGLLCLSAQPFGRMLAESNERQPLMRIGLLTDIHYADKDSTKTRFYRESTAKMEEAVEVFNREPPAFVVELGDFIDKAETVEQEVVWLGTIEAAFSKLKAPRHYVLGNHCVDTLTKEEFIAHTGAAKTSHYSFDHGGHHFVILDACYRADGSPYGRKNSDWQDANVPQAQIDWLRADLAKAALPTIVFAHQRLDVAGKHSVRNAEAVRAVLEQSGRTLSVFQGHSHKNEYQQIRGIHYVTLAAMIEGSGPENSGYCFLEVMADQSLRLQGFRQQANRDLSRG